MTQGGFGVKVRIASVAVATVLEVDWPELEKVLAEMTGHDAVDGYAVHVATGKRKAGSFAMTLGWDRAAATHEAIVDAFDSDDPVAFEIEDPDGDEVMAFSAHVFKMGRMTEQEDGMKCEVNVQPSGPVTITVASGL